MGNNLQKTRKDIFFLCHNFEDHGIKRYGYLFSNMFNKRLIKCEIWTLKFISKFTF